MSTENNQKPKIILYFHGYKSPGGDDYPVFHKYAKDKLKYPMEAFNYFENNDWESIKQKNYNSKIKQALDKYNDHEIIILAYSMGAVAAVANSYNRPNVSRIFMLVPVYKISWTKWILLLKEINQKKKEMKKRLGVERYKQLQERNKRSRIKNKYPFFLTWHINVYRIKSKKFLKKIKNKTIHLLLTKEDKAASVRKNVRFIEKNLNMKDNKVIKEWSNRNHFTILNAQNTEIYDAMINFANGE